MDDFAKKMKEALESGESNEVSSNFKKKIDEIEKKADVLSNKSIEELEEMVEKRSENVQPVSAEEAQQMDDAYNKSMSSIRIEEEMLASFAKIENEREELRRLEDDVEEQKARIEIMVKKHEEKYGKLP